uniref:Early growth response 2a n=1 Tax=Cyprinus carpio TaxID=7962 RepID=A0A8C1X0L5_CYPCA
MTATASSRDKITASLNDLMRCLPSHGFSLDESPASLFSHGDVGVCSDQFSEASGGGLSSDSFGVTDPSKFSPHSAPVAYTGKISIDAQGSWNQEEIINFVSAEVQDRPPSPGSFSTGSDPDCSKIAQTLANMEHMYTGPPPYTCSADGYQDPSAYLSTTTCPLTYATPSYSTPKPSIDGTLFSIIPEYGGFYQTSNSQRDNMAVFQDIKPFSCALESIRVPPPLTPLNTIRNFTLACPVEGPRPPVHCTNPQSVPLRPIQRPRKYPNRPCKTPVHERPTQADSAATEIPEPTVQDAGSRAAVPLSGGGMRPEVFAHGRADAPRAHPHRPQAVPVPHLHAQLQPQRPPHDAHTHAHWREALLL